MAAAWASIWGDTLESLPEADPGRHTLEHWWTTELSAFSNPTALELGAGKLAIVATIASAMFPGANTIASDIRPVNAERRSYAFVCDAPIEALPFDDETFDVVGSQFAFEYAPRERAARELVRVLKKGGAARLVLHHPDSMFRSNMEPRRQCLIVGRALAKALATSDASLRKLRLRQNLKAIDQAAKAFASSAEAADDLEAFRAITLASLDGARDSAHRAFVAQCEPALLLLTSQQEATLSESDMPALMDQFTALGCRTAQFEPLLSGPRPIAWAVRMEK